MNPTKQDILNTILKIASDHLGVVAPKYTNLNSSVSETYLDMYADSLDCVEIIMKIEAHYGISIPDDKLNYNNIKTFDDLCNLVYVCINQKQIKQKKSLFYRTKQLFQKLRG